MRKDTNVWRWLIVGILTMSCFSCTRVISSDIARLVDPRLSYTQIAANPQAFTGQVVILAGTIIEAKNLPQATRLEILQFPATSGGRPRIDQPSGGRFLVWAPDYLETAIYRPGRAITVAGDASGERVLPLGEATYRYPLLTPRQLHLWPENTAHPRWHFNIGVGFSKGF